MMASQKRSHDEMTSTSGKGRKFVPTPENLQLVLAAPQSLHAAVKSWNSMMTNVHVLVHRSLQPNLGVLEVRVTDEPAHVCIVASVVEAEIRHLGVECENDSVLLNTKKFELVMKQIVNKGALTMVYDKNAIENGYKLGSNSSFSRLDFLIGAATVTGSQSHIERDIPARVRHVVTSNVSDISDFISYLSASKAEVFYIRIRSDNTRVFLTIGADMGKDGTGVSASLTFYGTRTTQQQQQSFDSSTANIPINGNNPMLRSAHILKLDETSLEQPVCVGSDDNTSNEEIDDALATLEDSMNVVDEKKYFLVKFVASFLKGLEAKSKLTVAIVCTVDEKGEDGNQMLFLRSSTSKSVTEMLLGCNIPDDEL